MYITVKKIVEPVNNQNAIDALFDGNLDVVIQNIQEPTLIRTKTFEIDNAYTGHITSAHIVTVQSAVANMLSAHPNPEEEYTTFRIPKKTHGFREINAPKPELKKDLKQISVLLSGLLQMQCHDSAWAYIPGRDVVNAMKEHTANGSKWYLKIDLHDFFGSCNKEFIITQLKKLYPFAAYPSNTTDTLLKDIAILATKDDGLPQGTPLSPLLTNLIMVEFDYKINKLIYSLTKNAVLMKQKYIYTRYADDIIISARNKFEYNILLDALKDLFSNTPLTINEEKTRFGSSSGRNWNLGVMCNKDNNITIGYRKKQHLKTIINNYMKDRDMDLIWGLEDLYWLQGQLSWLHNVEPEYYTGFKRYLNDKYGKDVPTCIIQDIKHHNN